MKGKKTNQPKVLLVDDDPGIRESVGQVLSDQGANVTPVASLDEARTTLEEKDFALVLTDLKLEQGTEGLDVARIARQETPTAKVVLFSGQDLSEIEGEAAEVGVDEMLAKPLSLDALARILTDLGTETEQPAKGKTGRLTDTQGQKLLERFICCGT